MKKGDLVRFHKRYIDTNPWLVVSINKTKKVWHRDVTLYRGGILMTVPWKEVAIEWEVVNDAR